MQLQEQSIVQQTPHRIVQNRTWHGLAKKKTKGDIYNEFTNSGWNANANRDKDVVSLGLHPELVERSLSRSV